MLGTPRLGTGKLNWIRSSGSRERSRSFDLLTGCYFRDSPNRRIGVRPSKFTRQNFAESSPGNNAENHNNAGLVSGQGSETRVGVRVLGKGPGLLIKWLLFPFRYTALLPQSWD